MLLQTNSYVVPKERRSEHTRLLRRFKQVLHKLGCDHFEVYEQVGTNWTSDQTSGRFVQIMRFKDRKQQMAVQAAERDDPVAQAVIAEFCELINFPYQQQQGLFAIGYYTSILSSGKVLEGPVDHTPAPPPEPAPAVAVGEQLTMVVDREDLAETVAGQSTVEYAEPIRNPFAEAPIVAPEPPPEASEPDEPTASEPQPEPLPHSASDDLDELIRQHFGDASPGTNGDGLEHVPAAPESSEDVVPGSGIGAVLDASLHADDPDLDVPLPAELLDEDISAAPHTPHPSHSRRDEADE